MLYNNFKRIKANTSYPVYLLSFVLGNLMAFLTVNKVSLPADTLEELANQNTHKVGVVKDSAHELLFKVIFCFQPPSLVMQARGRREIMCCVAVSIHPSVLQCSHF